MVLSFFFFLGAVFGSFLNLLADRLPKEEDVLLKPSHCDFCKKRLAAIDLIPLISFVLQKGRCRYCRHKLSIKYPLVELITGLGFAFIYKFIYFFALPSPAFSSLLFLLVLFCVFLVIILADLWYFIIPDQMLVIGILSVFIYKIIYQRTDLVSSLITGFGASLFFYFLHMITRGKGMGLGDVKYAFLMGFLLGFPAFIVAFYIAFLTGALVGVILVIIAKAKLKTRIPFGPFLVLATAITFIWKEQLTMIFLKMLL